MCGIAGILVGEDDGIGANVLRQMASTMGHRGPDQQAEIVLRAGGGAEEPTPHGALRRGDVGLCHLRLSIIDLTPASNQPMSLDNGRLQLVYNGEIYNYLELREELRARGHVFKTKGDTEVLLHAYDEWGTACLERLNGMWSFALWDSRARTLFCAVDPCGIKPFYYLKLKGSTLLFASELKALLKVRDAPRRVDAARASLYLVTGVDLVGDGTFVSGIHRLAPGSALLASESFTRLWYWWKPQPAELPGTCEDVVQLVKETLRDSIRLRFRSDVPVGILLSGGVDSTGVACLARAMLNDGSLTGQPLRTFTASVNASSIDEGPIAARISREIEAETHLIRLDGKQLSEDLFDLIRAQDEPFASLSIYLQYCVMRRVRQAGTIVVLSGQGADELFLGYPWHPSAAIADLLRAGRVSDAVRLGGRIAHNSGTGLARLGAAVIATEFPATRSLLYRLRIGGLVQHRTVSGLLEPLLHRAIGALPGPDLLKRELTDVGLPGLLRYEDRNSMAFSVESRLPYLDYRLLQIAYALPAWSKLSGGWSKYFLRRALDGVAPHDVVWQRRKIGFAAPDARWLPLLRPLLQETFSGNVRSGGLVRPRAIVDGVAHGEELPRHFWRFLNLELWMRTFNLEMS